MKMKKFLPTFVASVFLTSSVLTTTASAVIAEASTPRIYVDIVYENDTQMRADIIFENIPETFAGGFHLNIDDGLAVNNINGGVPISSLNCTGRGATGILYNDGTGNKVFIDYAYDQSINPNGRFCSFYISKTDTYSETNSDISVYFTGNDYAHDFIASQLPNGKYVEYFSPDSNEEIELPVIEKASEYIVGDADGNARVNVIDSSAILSAISDNGNNPLYVSSIESNFTRFFPYAKAPAAPDANNDGIISELDADIIMNHYSSVSIGGSYVGAVGSKAVYEYYVN